MKTCFIHNPVSGSEQDINDLIRYYSRQSDCKMCRTEEKSGSAQQLARAAVEDGCDRVIAAGGDGTIHEVLNGIAPDFDAVELAIIPLGTGNDLARSLDIADSPETAFNIAFNDRAYPIDVGKFQSDQHSLYFLNAAAGGFGGQITDALEGAAKHRWGAFSYWATAMANLTDLPIYSTRLSINNEIVELDIHAIAVTNGRFAAGGFPAGPEAMMDDGKLNVLIVPAQPWSSTIAAGMDIFLGRTETSERLVAFGAHEIQIESKPLLPFSVDGEQLDQTNATLSVLPGALRVVAGPTPVALSAKATQAARE